MDADEKDICLYLRGWAGQFVSSVEISRRASGKRRFREDPNWVVPALGRLVEKGLVEADATGHYRLKPISRKDKRKQRWASPEMRKILQRSGKQFDIVHEIDDLETYLEYLESLSPEK